MSFGDRETKKVEVGLHAVHIEKMFGPLVACNVRVWLDYDPGQWVVERERTPAEGESTWEEMARFDCQESIEFG